MSVPMPVKGLSLLPALAAVTEALAAEDEFVLFEFVDALVLFGAAAGAATMTGSVFLG